MKVTILADHLLTAVKETERIAPKRGPLPILANLSIGTHQGRVTVTASDLTQAVTAYVGAQVHEEGSCTIPAATLKRMLTKIKGGRIELTGAKNGAALDIDGRTLKLAGDDPEDFPPVPQEFVHAAEVDGVLLKDRLNKVIGCVAGDDARPRLAGVHMVAKDSTLTLEATDGFRLARFTLPYVGGGFDCIVPSSAVTTLIRLLDDGLEGIGLSDKPKAIRFRLRHIDVVAQLIDAPFPDVEQVVPTEWDRTVTVQPADLIRELDTAGVIANQGSQITRLVTGDGTLRLSAKVEEVGEYAADIPAAIEGEPGRVAVDGSQLRGLVQMFDGPVSLRWADGSHRPLHISENDDGLYILMPMAVDWGKE